MGKNNPVSVTCPQCGQSALGNYKHNPNLAICSTCKAAGKPFIFTYGTPSRWDKKLAGEL